ncbi:MAG: MFS transporter [Anaerolineae bacterium]|nr:MFS transporter [Anaerolineae bacterium]
MTELAANARVSTLSALKSPNFRLYFVGQLVSVSGTWMQNVAEGYLVFKLTQSELWLGLVACAAGLPLIFLAPVAGTIVDRVPRRKLMMFTQTAQMILAFISAYLTFSDKIQVAHIVVLAFCLGITNALDAPARQTFVVEMVGRDDLQSGIALNSILNSASRVLGPTAAGLALVQFGPAWCFLINGLSFLAVLISLFFMDVPYAIKYVAGTPPLKLMREGFEFARRHEVVAPLLLLTAGVGLFTVPIIRLFPAYAELVLHSPTDGYALVSAAQGVGSILGGILVGWLSHRLGRGRVIGVSIILGAISTVLFAYQSNMALSAFMCTLTGVFLILEVVDINTLLQAVVPDGYRGRVLSLYTLTFLGLAPFSSVALGALATWLGTSEAIGIYGILGGVMGLAVIFRWRSVVRQR